MVFKHDNNLPLYIMKNKRDRLKQGYFKYPKSKTIEKYNLLQELFSINNWAKFNRVPSGFETFTAYIHKNMLYHANQIVPLLTLHNIFNQKYDVDIKEKEN